MENKWFFPEHVPVITDCPRCNFCCERLSAGKNWTSSRSRAGERRCRSCNVHALSVYKLIKFGSGSKKRQSGALRSLSIMLRSKAKKQGHIPPTIEEIEKLITQCLKAGCALCGIQVEIETNDRNSPNRLQIDQVTPRGGYTLDNMIGLCAPCNRQKSNHTLETSMRLTQFLAKRFDIEVTVKKKDRGRVVHADFQAKIKEAIATI